MTVQQLIESSMRLLGILASGESASSQERDDGLIVLNQLLSSWSAGGLAIPYKSTEALSLTGAATYTIGTGQTFNTPRPLVVTAAAVVVGGVTAGVRVVDDNEWLATRDFNRAGKFAEILFYNVESVTVGRISLWPTPANGGSLSLYSLKALTAFSALSDNISLPPGYERALRNALAIELAPEFGRSTKGIAELDGDAKGAIFGLNARVLGHPAEPAAPVEEAE